ncbi:hypothetical protein [Hymenobacter persicinus]|uniref:Glycosyltransferase RgtA/B/C/D-like domain-containing protein n=1 Tax=Hymenobacter persicinus TaxID=2025506 RepID=A0A4Q5LBY0_9BACT|nr:hypothetical protein [Hymenobacter persicinus]RYU78676.1 hypothetical protein EWM57_12805 [Hymenobacter persicinus]
MRQPASLLPHRLRRPLVSLFFGVLGLLGVLLHRDYGLPWDEQLDRLNGIISLKYVALKLAPERARQEPSFSAIPDMRDNQDTDHGVIFQLPLLLLERAVGAHDSRDVYFLRHLVTFFTFLAGLYFFYRLATARFRSWTLGLLGAALLIGSPRFFAEAFYNYKDLVFLAFFSTGIYTLTRLLRRPTWRTALLHAAATGAAIDVRTMGVLLVGLTLGFVGLELLYRPTLRSRFATAAALCLPATAAVVVLGWPYLWENPVGHFLEAFQSFRQYRSDMLVQYLGEQVSVRELPWHYVPVWLLITTPLAYSLFFVTGAATLAHHALQRPRAWLRTRTGRQDLLFAAWFFGPLLAVIGLHSVIYDGWRHLYFIYPAFVLLALRGISRTGYWARRGESGIGRLAALGALLALAGNGAYTTFRMVREHPYQNMYFSGLSGTAAERLFERDYWGLSGREGLEWILAHDASPRVKVGTDARTGLMLHNASLMLLPAERARVVLTSADQATYLLTVYRWHPQPYPATRGREVHQIRVEGIKILSVFRR